MDAYQTIPPGKRLLQLDAGRTSDAVKQQICARDLPAVLFRMAIDESDNGRTTRGRHHAC